MFLIKHIISFSLGFYLSAILFNNLFLNKNSLLGLIENASNYGCVTYASETNKEYSRCKEISINYRQKVNKIFDSVLIK